MIYLRARFVGGPKDGDFTDTACDPSQSFVVCMDYEEYETYLHQFIPRFGDNVPIKLINYKLYTFTMTVANEGTVVIPLYICEGSTAPKTLLSALLKYTGA